MPTYAAVCEKCGFRYEYSAKISESDSFLAGMLCLRCDTPLKRGYIANEGGFQLKGTGWFRDGYASKPKGDK